MGPGARARGNTLIRVSPNMHPSKDRSIAVQKHLIPLFVAGSLAGCVLQTDTVPGRNGETGETGSEGPAGVSPFSFNDDSMTDIHYSGGNVGLGIVDPTGHQLSVSGFSRFQVDGPGRVESIEVLNGNGAKDDEPTVVFLGRTKGLATYRLGSIGGVVEDNDDQKRKGALVFRTSDNETMNESMRITGDGRVGIGRTAPAAPLEVSARSMGNFEDILYLSQGTEDSYGYVFKVDNTVSGDLYLQRRENGGEPASELLTFSSDGRVGIGATSPSERLQVAGNILASGTITGDLVDTCSRALKQDILDVSSEDALVALDALRPVRFRYKASLDEEQVGFIAEDVPDLVATNDRRGVGAMDVVAVLTRVVQTQQERLTRQQAELASLHAENARQASAQETLVRRLARLEDQVARTMSIRK